MMYHIKHEKLNSQDNGMLDIESNSLASAILFFKSLPFWGKCKILDIKEVYL